MNNHIFRVSFLVSIFVLAITGCQKEPVGTVNGTFTTFDPSKPLIKVPVDSIRVYLVDMDFKADTVNPNNNKASLIDSIYTDTEGVYSFNNIPEGNYAIVPCFTSKHFKFLPDNAGQTFTFSVAADKTDHEINFTAPIPGSENDYWNFHMTFNFVNAPPGSSIDVQRRMWAGFMPGFYFATTVTPDNNVYTDTFGYTAIFYTLDNCFFFAPYVKLYGQQIDIGRFDVSWLVAQMPHEITVTIDFKAKTMEWHEN